MWQSLLDCCWNRSWNCCSSCCWCSVNLHQQYLACWHPIHLSVYPYLANSTDRLMQTLLWQLFPDCRRWGLSLLVHDSSFSSWLQFPRGSSDAVEQHTISGILFWNSANASRKTIRCGVPTTAISDSSLIPRKVPWCHFASTWTFLLEGLGKIRFQTKAHIGVAFSNDRRLCDSLSFHRFHTEICVFLELQILHTMGVKHVISQLSHRVTHVQNISTCELSLIQF